MPSISNSNKFGVIILDNLRCQIFHLYINLKIFTTYIYLIKLRMLVDDFFHK